MRAIAVIAAAFVACSKPPPSVVAEDVVAPKASVSVTPVLHTKNVCIVDAANGTVFLHALIPVTWKGADADTDDRILWSVRCELKDGACEGVRLDVKRIEDRAGEVRPLNYKVVRTMKLLSIAGSIAVLEYDGATFTLDAIDGHVRVTSSSKRGEGRGDVTCAPSAPDEFLTP